MSQDHHTIKASVRLLLGNEIALGPGKAELLAAIRDTGSISAAARQMGMSYRRAWLLVETMNACFITPLVSTATGGRSGGGARLTEAGETVLTAYRSLLEDVNDTATSRLAGILEQVPLRDPPHPGKSSD